MVTNYCRYYYAGYVIPAAVILIYQNIILLCIHYGLLCRQVVLIGKSDLCVFCLIQISNLWYVFRIFFFEIAIAIGGHIFISQNQQNHQKAFTI